MQKLLKGLLWTAGIVALLLVVLRLVAFKVWTIPDDPVLAASIAPTLRAGDRVVILTRGTPGFGELVRCPDPDDPQRFVVGRVAGFGGDKVSWSGPSLVVDGKSYGGQSRCEEGAIAEIPHPTTGAPVEVSCEMVEMGGVIHKRGGVPPEDKLPLPAADEVTTVQDNMVYLASDNRDYHDDSRDFGLLPRASCSERIVFRLWGKEGFFKDEKGRFSLVH